MNKLLSINEAAELLGVSRTTFNKIRKESEFREVLVGKRVRFYEDDLLAHLGQNGQGPMGLRTEDPVEQISTGVNSTGINSTGVNENLEKLTLNIFSDQSVRDIEIEKNVFDLRTLNQLDPYGVLSLLCTLIVRAKSSEKIRLIVDDNYNCQYLKSINFFYELERECGGSIEWDKYI